MPISITKITSEIAKVLSLKHHKDIAYRTITQNDYCMIIGLCVEPIFTPSTFSVTTFIQALYIPFPAINLSLGERIGNWNRTDLNISLPVIQKCYNTLPCDSIATIIDHLNKNQLKYYGGLEGKYQFLAYSYIVIKQYEYAKYYLKRIIAFENDDNAYGTGWRKILINNAKQMLNLLEQENWKDIRSLLLCWQKETMTALKLPE